MEPKCERRFTPGRQTPHLQPSLWVAEVFPCWDIPGLHSPRVWALRDPFCIGYGNCLLTFTRYWSPRRCSRAAPWAEPLPLPVPIGHRQLQVPVLK